MPSLTVREIRNQRAWPSPDEAKVIYYDFLVEGRDEMFNVGRKPGNDLAVGQVIEGELESDGRGGFKVKAAPKNGFGGGGRGRDPVEEAKTRRSIQMQHAQKCAVDALKLAAEYGTGENKYQPPSAADVIAQVKVIASGLFQQIEEVSK